MTDRYLTPKELRAALEGVGVRVCLPYVRRLIAALPTGQRIGYSARLSDAVEFLRKHPTFKPFAKDAKGATVFYV